jgi:glycosyltransferase involved in cell wall biosynthesis
MSRVDVVVPCYNYGRFMRECIYSVLTQEGVEVRVLIVDDCSQDDSEAIGRKLAAEDPRVEYRRNPVNKGHITTYNSAFDWLRAEYTLFLSADDLLAPGALKRAADLMDAHANVGVVYGKILRWEPGTPKPVYAVPAAPPATEVIPGRDWIAKICASDPLTTSPEVVMRTTLLKQIGRYRLDLPHWADVDLFMKLAAHGAVGRVDWAQAYYRLHGRNMNLGYQGLKDLDQRRLTFRGLFDECRDLIPNGDALRAVALRNVADRAVGQAYLASVRKDYAAFRECLAFAAETDPGVVAAPLYRRLRLKLRVGPWAVVARVRRQIGAELSCVGYLNRQQGQYWTALYYYLASLRWGKLGALREICKLPPHWLLRLLGRVQ